MNVVETYVQLDEAAQEEHERLLAAEANRGMHAMEMTWAGKTEAEGLEKDIRTGLREGNEKGRLGGLRTPATDLLERRSGRLPEEHRARPLAVAFPDELTPLFEPAVSAHGLAEVGR